MYAAAVLISGVIIVMCLRLSVKESGSPIERARRGRLVGIASGTEGLAILISVNILANIGRRDLTGPVIAIIVGLHFLPLAYWLPRRLYYASSLALVIAGLAGMLVPDSNVRLYAVSVSAACILWLTSGMVLWLGQQQEAAQ